MFRLHIERRPVLRTLPGENATAATTSDFPAVLFSTNDTANLHALDDTRSASPWRSGISLTAGLLIQPEFEAAAHQARLFPEPLFCASRCFRRSLPFACAEASCARRRRTSQTVAQRHSCTSGS